MLAVKSPGKTIDVKVSVNPFLCFKTEMKTSEVWQYENLPQTANNGQKIAGVADWTWPHVQNMQVVPPKTYLVKLCLLSNKPQFITARKRSLGQSNIFSPVCHSVHRGVYSRGVPGGSGLGGLVPGGCLIPGGCLVPGGYLVETPWDGYCCGRYASYWNAFLFT